MKILYVIHQFYPSFYSGTERVSLNIADMVQKMGNIVKFVTYCPHHNVKNGNKLNSVVYGDYMVEKIPVTEFYSENETDFYNVNIVNDELLEFANFVLEKEKPDVVHVMHPMRCGVFVKAAQEKGIKVVVTATDLMYICSQVVMCKDNNELCCSAEKGKMCDLACPSTGKQHSKRIEQAETLLKNADCVTAPSSFIAQMLSQELNGVNSIVVKHGVETMDIYNNRIYNKQSKIVFGFVGTLQMHKGLHVFIENALKVDSQNVAFKIYGDYNNEYAMRYVKRVKKDNRFSFEGKFDKKEAAKVYSDIDVIVIPSQCYESYSMVKYEAIRAGIPVIVSDLGALPEGITNKENGFVFDASQKKALLDVMNYIISNPDVLNSVIAETKKIFVPIKEQEAFKYCSIYKNICKKSSKSI